MRLPGWATALFLLAGVMEPGCQRKHAVFTPPPAPPPEHTALPVPEQLPQPPEVLPEPAQPTATLPPQPGIPPPPSQPRPRRVPSAAPEAPASAPATATPAAPVRLGPLMTPEQERDLNAQLDQALAGAEANLRAMGDRRLRKDQEAAVAQVRSFIRQAREIRKTDLTAARSLAHRADILARDLARSFR